MIGCAVVATTWSRLTVAVVRHQCPQWPLLWLFCAGLFIVPVRAEEPQALVIAGDAWCPFNCDPEIDQRRGYMVELLEAIAQDQGFAVRYEIMPWNRTLLMLKEGKVDVSLGDDPDPQFLKTRQSWAAINQSYVTLKERHFVWHGVDSLRDRRVLLIQGTDHGAAIKNWAVQHPGHVSYIHGETPDKQALDMLQGKRVDVYIHAAEVVGWTLRSRVDRAAFVVTKTGRTKLEYLMLSNTLPDNLLWRDRLDQGLQSLRARGELQRILDTYGMQDWQPSPK